MIWLVYKQMNCLKAAPNQVNSAAMLELIWQIANIKRTKNLFDGLIDLSEIKNYIIKDIDNTYVALGEIKALR